MNRLTRWLQQWEEERMRRRVAALPGALRAAGMLPSVPGPSETHGDPPGALGPARHALRQGDPRAGLRYALPVDLGPGDILRASADAALRVRPLPFAPVGESAAAASSEGPRLPERAYPNDAGFDLFVTEDAVIRPHEFVDIHCHLAVELPEGVWALVIGRSSTLRKRGLMVNPGIIDTGYRGELFTGVWNLGPTTARVEFGERLAQIILFENMTARFYPQATDQLGDSLRGSRGFGSSGT